MFGSASFLQINQILTGKHIQQQVILADDFIHKLALENELALLPSHRVEEKAIHQVRRQSGEIGFALVTHRDHACRQFYQFRSHRWPCRKPSP